jgi:peptide-methionine (S)-S-oxide reductase
VEKLATFGAGCFWGVEAAFRRVDGVTRTRVGYAGGKVEHPSYEQVCSDATGHAEVVEVAYDDERVPYEQLLAIFWAEHDPTQVNRQGPDQQGLDLGSQYRSVILVHDEEQRAAAEVSLARLQRRLSRPVATTIEDAPRFWEAEDYHQRYLEKRGLASCTPKLAGVAAGVA